MNKKQIKQDKLLKKKVLYQQYWKSIFIQSNKGKDKIKDGDTNTNIVELQLKGEIIQNKESLQQGFDKVLSEQNHILKFPNNQSLIQENKILQQQTQNNSSQQHNKATQINEYIQHTQINVEIQNIAQKHTINQEQGNNQIDVMQKTNSKNNTNNYNEKKQHPKVKTKNSQQQQQHEESQQTNIRYNQRNEKSIHQSKDINSQQQLSIVQNNINQQKNQRQFIKESDNIPKDLSQTQQPLKIENNSINKNDGNCIKKKIEQYQQFEHFINDQISNQLQSSTNIIVQTKTQNNSLVIDSTPQEIKVQNDVLNQDNVMQQCDHIVNHESNTPSTVTRNQLKAVHKVMRSLQEKLHQDEMKIQVIWDEVLAQEFDLVPNFEKFIQCIQFLHNLEKVHFDQQKLTAQLL